MVESFLGINDEAAPRVNNSILHGWCYSWWRWSVHRWLLQLNGVEGSHTVAQHLCSVILITGNRSHLQVQDCGRHGYHGSASSASPTAESSTISGAVLYFCLRIYCQLLVLSVCLCLPVSLLTCFFNSFSIYNMSPCPHVHLCLHSLSFFVFVISEQLNLCLYLSLSISVFCLAVFLSVSLSVCLCLSLCMYLFTSVCLFVSLSVSLSPIPSLSHLRAVAFVLLQVSRADRRRRLKEESPTGFPWAEDRGRATRVEGWKRCLVSAGDLTTDSIEYLNQLQLYTPCSRPRW